MANCSECGDGMTLEDLLRLVIVCDDSGNISWRLKAVEGETHDCSDCSASPLSLEDLIRRSIDCDNGVYSIKFSVFTPL
jgi:hypothetical protein